MTLRHKVSHGLLWEGGAMIAGRALSLVVTLLMARLLAPSSFGLVSIATLAINSLVFFQELGFGAALIYRRDEVDRASHTAHWTIVASSTLLYMIAFAAAPLVAQFFRTPEVTAVLRVLALTIVISSLSRVPYSLLYKELDFRRKVLPEFLASFGGNAAALLLVVLGWGVWGLVWGQIVDAMLRTALVYWACPWRPRLTFDRPLFRQLFGFGKHVATSQILIFGVTNIDDLFVGRMLGDTALGQYGMAYRISNLPATNITRLVTRVTFPAFSQLQNDIGRMRSIYFRMVRYVSYLAMPVAVATVIFARDFVYVVLTDVWAPIITPLQLLAIYGLLRSVAANMGTVFQAGGKPQWLSSIALWRFITMAILLYPAIKLGGINGVCLLSAAVALVDFFISGLLSNRILQARMSAYWRVLLPLLALGAMAGAVGYLAEQGLRAAGLRPIIALLAGGAVLLLVYGAVIYWRDPEVRQESNKVISRLRQRNLPKAV
jgi:O-antigen/teichoic acid export membrane protein